MAAGALTTIATFSTPMAAQLAKLRLEAGGVPCYLANELDARTVGLGRVSLQVPAEAVEAARELLARGSAEAHGETAPREAGFSSPSAASWGGGDGELERCLVCQSSLVELREPSFVLRFLRVVVLQILPIPAPWLETRGRRCGICSHEWRADETVRLP